MAFLTSWRTSVALLVIGFAAILAINLTVINIFDEGFVATGPMLILDGGLPMRDFLTMYGPGQFYLQALFFAIFGEQLIVLRMVHVGILALLGVAIHRLALALGGAHPLGALWVWAVYIGVVYFVIPTVGYAAHTSALMLLFAVLALGRTVDTDPVGALVRASMWVGLAGVFRWDFGLFGILALGVCMLFSAREVEGQLREQLRRAAAALLPAILIWLIVYGVVLVLLGDPLRWFREVVLFSAFEFKKWRGISFVRPALDSVMHAWVADVPLTFVAGASLTLLYALLPVTLVLSTLTWVVVSSRGLQKSWTPDRVAIQALFLALLCFLMFNQMRVRPTTWQGFAAMSACLPLMLFLYGRCAGEDVSARIRRGALSAAGVLFTVALILTGAETVRGTLMAGFDLFPAERARGLRVPPQNQSYAQVVQFVRDQTVPGEAIYSGAVNHQVLLLNDVMLYFLAERPPADRFMELEPGIANTVEGQTEIIQALINKKVRLVVLAEIYSMEDNLSSEPNGVGLLDSYLKQNYRMVKRVPPYRILLRNDAQLLAPSATAPP